MAARLTDGLDLLLWRHAEAADASATLADRDRPLTARGEKQAKAVARWLRRRQPESLTILVSPALRCRQTALALQPAFAVDERLAPGAAAADLLAACGTVGGAVLLVGHQPTLGQLAALLLAGGEADWSVKKGGLWWFGRRAGEVQLRAVINPDLL